MGANSQPPNHLHSWLVLDLIPDPFVHDAIDVPNALIKASTAACPSRHSFFCPTIDTLADSLGPTR
ncbi:hypothetical protein BD310DRAFT_941887 [Dichomitus squalens]|uniref:Uncharacterized protein n=1 Tax=Dichomitus squalens TaxID=114155 RepID=A0A4Q9PEG4_9APHY|nr:hypothetical protein BD310DRAFT_941887 [Dichomitus squalens]